MDRTIARLNTEEIINEVNNVITTGLEKLLGNHLYRYELLEKTHEAIMNLPNVRHHLNLAPLSQCEFKPEAKTDVMTEFDTKYGRMIEKMLNRIDELTLEVNQLKNSYKPEHVEVVKLEQKENIKLEIQEEEDEAAISEVANSVASSVASLEEDEEADEEEEETSVASLEEEASVASLEEADESLEELVASLDEAVANLEVASLENICSECDCKVILKEDIIIVDGKKYCGACDPSNASEDEVASEKDEEEVASEDEVTSEKDEVETEAEASEEEAEASEEEAEASEEEEYIEIDIDDVTYCTNNEDNGFIYELTEDGDVGNKVGYLKDGEPFFYADEK